MARQAGSGQERGRDCNATCDGPRGEEGLPWGAAHRVRSRVLLQSANFRWALELGRDLNRGQGWCLAIDRMLRPALPSMAASSWLARQPAPLYGESWTQAPGCVLSTELFSGIFKCWHIDSRGVFLRERAFRSWVFGKVLVTCMCAPSKPHIPGPGDTG